jgi:hypothetical protein
MDGYNGYGLPVDSRQALEDYWEGKAAELDKKSNVSKLPPAPTAAKPTYRAAEETADLEDILGWVHDDIVDYVEGSPEITIRALKLLMIEVDGLRAKCKMLQQVMG